MPVLFQQSAEASSAARLKSAPRFVPICFSRIPDDVLCGFPLHLRNLDARGAESFTLYAAPGTTFTAEHRRRLYDLGANFLYIPEGEQRELRRQLEERVEKIASDRGMDLAERCEIVYETAFELIDDTFAKRDLRLAVPRLRRVAGAIVGLHLENPLAFTHFVAASRHDACAATHAVNAAAWLPALARALGNEPPAALQAMCLGALLYDVGMAYLPPAIRQNRGKLGPAEKQAVQQHPEMGAQFLREMIGLDPVVALMAIQHHERLDGSGYPRGLTFDRIHPVARMIAIIDTYDAVTSFRPYRSVGASPSAGLAMLRREATHRFDPVMVDAWAKLLCGACPEISAHPATASATKGISRRRFERYAVKCPATLQRVELVKGMWTARESVEAVAHNLSRGGLGLLCRLKLVPGQYYRAKLRKKDGQVQDLELMIVRERLHGEGWFEAGARFVDLEREAAPLPNGEFV